MRVRERHLRRPIHSTISVTPQDQYFIKGLAVVFSFTLANDSDEMLFVDGFDGDWNYNIVLKDANDRDAPPTADNKLTETPHVQRRTGRVLHPGEKATASVDLTKVFVLDSPGTYRLVVRSSLIRWGAGMSEEIVSPEFSFVLYP